MGVLGVHSPFFLTLFSLSGVSTLTCLYLTSVGSIQSPLGLSLISKLGVPFTISQDFLEWLTGFTDAEGNFHISLKHFSENTFKSVQLTFQIGLHIDHLSTLQAIQSALGCGSISVSGKKCNFFVNDIHSLYNIIIPVFDHFTLNSSKYAMYLIWREAVHLVYAKLHLSDLGRTKLIELRQGIRDLVLNPVSNDAITLTLTWLLGFIEGDGTFSTSTVRPRLKLENSIVEQILFNAIKTYFGYGSMSTSDRKRSVKESPTVSLEFSTPIFLLSTIIPAFSGLTWYTSKHLDFLDWSIIVDLNAQGYHLLPEGAALILLIKSRMNNFRLSTNSEFNGKLVIDNKLIQNVYNLPAPYLLVQDNDGWTRIKNPASARWSKDN